MSCFLSDSAARTEGTCRGSACCAECTDGAHGWALGGLSLPCRQPHVAEREPALVSLPLLEGPQSHLHELLCRVPTSKRHRAGVRTLGRDVGGHKHSGQRAPNPASRQVPGSDALLCVCRWREWCPHVAAYRGPRFPPCCCTGGKACPGSLQRAGRSSVLERPACCLCQAFRGSFEGNLPFPGQVSCAGLSLGCRSSALRRPAVHFWGSWTDTFSQSRKTLSSCVSTRCFLLLSLSSWMLQKALGFPLCPLRLPLPAAFHPFSVLTSFWTCILF